MPRSARRDVDAVELAELLHPVRGLPREHDTAGGQQIAQRRQHVEGEPLGRVLVGRVQERPREHEQRDGGLGGRRAYEARVVDPGPDAVATGADLRRAGHGHRRRMPPDGALDPPAGEATLDLAGEAEDAGVDSPLVGDAPLQAVGGHASELAPVAARQIDEVDDRPRSQVLRDGEERLRAGAPDDVRLGTLQVVAEGGAGRGHVRARRRPRAPRCEGGAGETLRAAAPSRSERDHGDVELGRQPLLLGGADVLHDHRRRGPQRADRPRQPAPSLRHHAVVVCAVEEDAQHLRAPVSAPSPRHRALIVRGASRRTRTRRRRLRCRR